MDAKNLDNSCQKFMVHIRRILKLVNHDFLPLKKYFAIQIKLYFSKRYIDTY